MREAIPRHRQEVRRLWPIAVHPAVVAGVLKEQASSKGVTGFSISGSTRRRRRTLTGVSFFSEIPQM
jgi:hypothetical protein